MNEVGTQEIRLSSNLLNHFYKNCHLSLKP